ncbi:MAG TPA: phasin family protein [Verrucomicrobiae bacterium]|nr:phasin family protein [Verrucomicrobiae bacterium]
MARVIGSLLNNQGKVKNVECKSESLESEFRAPTVATAYGDYTKKSFEDTKLFVEKLSGVKSLDKALEVQTEFAKTAYETFVTESQKIAALYGDLAKQSYKPFGGFVAEMTPTNR